MCALVILGAVGMDAQIGGSGAIVRGRVLTEGSATGIKKATVHLLSVSGQPDPRRPPSAGAPLFTAQTDADGTFVFAGVSAGRYAVMAEKQGFVAPDPMQPLYLEVAPSGDPDRITVKLRAPGTIIGRVCDADGDPIVNAQVTAMKVRATRNAAMSSRAMTNDLGEYRLFHVAPGKYVVLAMSGAVSGAGPASPSLDPSPLPELPRPTFYPGVVTRAEATAVIVESGGEVRGIDIRAQRAPQLRIIGRVASTDSARTSLSVTSLDRLAAGMSMGYGAGVGPDGRFSLDVRSGERYAVVVSATHGNQQRSAARVVNVKEADVDLGLIELRPPANLKGQVRWPEGQPGAPSLVLQLVPAGGNGFAGRPYLTRTDAAGNFEFVDVAPAEYDLALAHLTERNTLFPESIRFGDRDFFRDGLVLDGGEPPLLRIVLKANGAEADFSVVDEEKHPLPSALVYVAQLIPTPGFSLTGGRCVTDASGSCRVLGMRPGEYRVIALRPDAVFGSSDPEDWTAVADHTQRLRLELGSPKTLTLTVQNVD